MVGYLKIKTMFSIKLTSFLGIFGKSKEGRDLFGGCDADVYNVLLLVPIAD
jgi:hypothetical protein